MKIIFACAIITSTARANHGYRSLIGYSTHYDEITAASWRFRSVCEENSYQVLKTR